MRLIILALTFRVLVGANMMTINALRQQRLSRLQISLKTSETRLQTFRPDTTKRVVFDNDRLTCDSFFLQMDPSKLLEYIQICSRVSLIGQGRYEPIDSAETVSILQQPYQIKQEFIRGQGQISGYLFLHCQGNITKLIAVFAGTSTKYDAICATMVKEISLHDINAHGGVRFLVYQNLSELNKIVELERFAGNSVDLVLAGHSLGGAIAQLGGYDLRVRWRGDSGVRIRCLNLAGPSPFRTHLKRQVEEVIGYNNMMSILRRADYIYQLSESVDLLSAGPTVYLKDRYVDEKDVVKRVRKQFGHNHYVSEYVNDILGHRSDGVWEYLATIRTKLEIERQIKLETFLVSQHE